MTATIAADLSNIIVDPLSYQDGDAVDEAFKAIRRDTPFAKAQADEYDNFWVVSRHADIKEIERQPEFFHNGDKSTFLTTLDGSERTKMLTGGEPNLIRSLVSVDGKEHKDLRGVVFPHVTPRAIRPLEEAIRGIAREFVDHMLSFDGEVDFAQDVAFLYPLRVIMQVLGVPKEDEPFMLKLTQELFNNADPELNRARAELSPEDMLKSLWETTMELENYFKAVTEKFRANPTEQVNSLIANAKIDGEYLNHRQMMGYYIIAATAGHDTTSASTAGAMLALARDPEQLAKVKADRSLLPNIVEEAIRWTTPVQHFMRMAAEDTEISGVRIAKGDWLMINYVAANHDPEQFDNPRKFDVTRDQTRHLAFGAGAHQCLGLHLARLEMRLLFEALLDRIERVELAGEPRRARSTFVGGLKTLPLRIA